MTTGTTAEPELRAVHPGGAAPRVLVVDDEPAIRELLELVLRYDGWDVRATGDGTTALETAAVFGPDVVLLDVMLPDLDGFEVLRRLRAGRPRLPVMFVSARDSRADRLAGLSAGGDDYLVKPFLLEDLVGRLHQLLVRGHGTSGQAGSLPST
jgi:two-component system, OmpR family, response regulator